MSESFGFEDSEFTITLNNLHNRGHGQVSLNRYAKRRDQNEPELVKLARKLGAQMEQVGPLDYWCGRGGVWVPVEIKSLRGQYTRLQKKFLSNCQLNYLPAWKWTTESDVLKCFNVVSKT